MQPKPAYTFSVTPFHELLAADPTLAALLVVAALCAGWVDAVVGGGGLIMIPALLVAFPGAAPATAIGTTKVVSGSGTASAAITYLRSTSVPRRFLAYTVAVACICAGLGALAATAISTAWMRPIVLILLVAVGTWVALRPSFGGGTARPHTRAATIAGLCAAAIIAFYDGIFGPGTGTFLIMAFTALVTGDFLRSAAMAKVVNLATNLGALAVFALTGHVVWLLGVVLAVANIVGSQIGARMAIARGSGFVRAVLLVAVIAMALRIGWDMWGG